MFLPHSATDDTLDLLEAMDALVADTKFAEERRGELRLPSVRPVTVTLEGPAPRTVQALTRDLAFLGVGLVHTEPLEPGEATLAVPMADGTSLSFRIEILWAKPLGDHWHISGSRLLAKADPPSGDPAPF